MIAVAHSMEQPTTFLEYHEYVRGLDTHFVGDGERPGWLPDENAVGLHNEIELKTGDYAIELARFRTREGRRVTWIGCFTHAVDKIHGNRGNYCGVGVWLIDTFPLYATWLVNGLKSLCQVLLENSDAAARRVQLDSFRTGYVHEYVRDLGMLPVELSGLAFSTNDISETEYFRAPHAGGDSGFAIVGRSILQLCAAAPKGFSANRALYFLAKESAIKIVPEKIVQLPAAADGSPDVVDRLLITFFDHIKLANASKLELATLKKTIADNAIALETSKAERKRIEAEKAKLESEKSRWESDRQRLEAEIGRLTAERGPVRMISTTNTAPGLPEYTSRSGASSSLQSLVEGQVGRFDAFKTEMESFKSDFSKRLATLKIAYWAAGIIGAISLLSLVLAVVALWKIPEPAKMTARTTVAQKPTAPQDKQTISTRPENDTNPLSTSPLQSIETQASK